jgi:hypothetical protein
VLLFGLILLLLVLFEFFFFFFCYLDFLFLGMVNWVYYIKVFTNYLRVFTILFKERTSI